MSEAGKITFSTKLDNKELEKDYADLKKKIRKLEDDLKSTTAEKTGLEKSLENAQKEADATKSSLDELTARYKILSDAKTFAGGKAAMLDEVRAERESLAAKIAEQTTALAGQNAEIDKTRAKLKNATTRADEYTEQLEAAKEEAGQIGERLATVEKRSGKAATALEAARFKATNFFKRVGNLMTSVLVFSVLTKALTEIRNYFSQVVASSKETTQAINGLKIALQLLVLPIINALLPALNKLITTLTTVIAYLARGVSRIFGTTIDKTIAQIQKMRQGSEGAAKAAQSQAKGLKAVGKAAQGANRYLAGFDEKNLQAEASMSKSFSDGSDASGGGADLGAFDATESEGINWDAFDEAKLAEKINAIQAILAGTALLVIGALLAFSGINITLGLTLMAIGALMLYTALSEDWNALPPKVKKVLTAVLAFGGLLALTIGIVLLCTGHFGLGIGLLLVGATLLAAAVAVNWDALKPYIEKYGSITELVVGGVAIAIGFALCFGGHWGLGIALMALGCAAVVHAVATNWDAIREKLQPISGYIAIAGGVGIVIGILLCFAGHWGIGVALMAAGALALATAVAVNWDLIKDTIGAHLEDIITVVSGCLLALGVALLLTGVAIPLGIALIVAGAAGLVAVTDIDWMYIPNKIKEIFGIIKNWWTGTAWPGITGAAKKLGEAFVSALEKIWGFFERIGDKIGSFFDGLAIGSDDVRIPEVPALAAGAVIPPNRSFLSVLGDQTSGNNLEAPEGLIRQIVREESGGGVSEEILMRILDAIQRGQTLYVDGRVLGRTAQSQINNMTRMGGAR